MITQRDQQLNELLDAAIASFDIPDTLYELAVRRYEDVGQWLAARSENSRSSGEVYPQGSFRLGTVVRPIGPRDQYDIDMVYRRDVLKESISQATLKANAGNDLGGYVRSEPEGRPSLEDGKRCWTLNYPLDPFHIDVLPAIPDLDGVRNAILLTDKKLREWQHSNPIDYSQWFHERMAIEFTQLREKAAVAINAMDVADVPEWKVKTTLQRTIQALKRHRDLFFTESPDDRPASIIITTLAARSYTGGGTLHEVLVAVTAGMPGSVEQRDGVWWVPNPIQSAENFADRWRDHPRRADLFFDWIEQAHSDFAGYGAEPGVHRILDRVGESLGAESAKAAGGSLGSGLFETRRSGQLGIAPASAGLLSLTATRSVPPHTFHGGHAARRLP